MFDPNGWTVGYSRDGIASIGQLHMAETHAMTPGGTWVRWEETPMTCEAALAIVADVNAGVRAAKARAATCETCGRVLP